MTKLSEEMAALQRMGSRRVLDFNDPVWDLVGLDTRGKLDLLGRADKKKERIMGRDLPYRVITAEWNLPFPLREFQQETVNDLAPLPRAGYYLDTGLGKTACSTYSALYKRTVQGSRLLVLGPPILTPTWMRWLQRFPKLRTMAYTGNPRERVKLRLDGDVIVCPLTLFKKELDRFMDELADTNIAVIVDEATSIKNIATDNHKAVDQFVAGKDLMLLTATALSSPMDAYAYCKLVAPGTYRNLNHFRNLHVGELDFFDNVMTWNNLDLMHSNLLINAKRFKKRDVIAELPPITFTPVYYDLDPKHWALYRQLAEEQLLVLESGGKIDATNTTALYNKLQQIILNWAYFAEDEKLQPAGFRVADEVLEELGTGKLMIYANYRMTNRSLHVRYAKTHNAVAVYGDISKGEQQKALDRFVKDPACRVFIGQPTAAGYGLDGLQEVCSDMLFLEAPIVPRDFHQSYGRIERIGQMNAMNVRIAVAEKTLQPRLLDRLMSKDELINIVEGGVKDLREYLFGGRSTH